MDIVEPSNAEQTDWPDATRNYVHGLETEITRLRAELERAKIFAEEQYLCDSEIIDKIKAERDALREHIAGQVTHVETRIQDGIEMGATVWRIALEDNVRENRKALEAGMKMQRERDAAIAEDHPKCWGKR